MSTSKLASPGSSTLSRIPKASASKKSGPLTNTVTSFVAQLYKLVVAIWKWDSVALRAKFSQSFKSTSWCSKGFLRPSEEIDNFLMVDNKLKALASYSKTWKFTCKYACGIVTLPIKNLTQSFLILYWADLMTSAKYICLCTARS